MVGEVPLPEGGQVPKHKLKTCPRCGAGYYGRHTRQECDWYKNFKFERKGK
jgi:hypothetical protein